MFFTQSLWQSIEPIYASILNHPFNQELTAGTLPKEKFQFYIKQDALYLTDFAKALAVIAAKSDTADSIISFIKFSEGAITAERGLHEFYLDLYQTSLDVSYATTCFTYTNYMLATASLRSYEEGIAALLSCFWIYREVGNHIFAAASRLNYDSNPYKKWIDMYSGAEYSAVVEHMISITNQVAAEASTKSQALMKTAFVYSSRLEWMFWESAYQLEKWKP
jgi:thiaminase (transcriptional activator TenA)